MKITHAPSLVFSICCILFIASTVKGQGQPLNGLTSGDLGRPITFNLEWDCLHGDPHDTLFWDFGTGASPAQAITPGNYDGVISEKFSQTVTFWTPGTKTFTFTDVSSVNSPYTDTFTIHISDPTAGVVSPSQPSITVSPNPTRGIITIENAPENISSVSVMNVLGATVIEMAKPSSSDSRVDLTKLPSGTYYVRFVIPGAVITRKIVRE